MTEIKMVSNSERNHLDELRSLFQLKASRLIIASPYLASNMTELLNEFSFSNIESIELVTTFKPKDSEQLTKPKILKDFFEYFMEKYPSIKIKLNVDNQLHGKIYVSIKDASRSLILGSANFTRSGLQNNHEWGVLINDDAIIEEIVDDLLDTIEYPDVTYTQIINACLIAVEYERDNPEWAKTPDVYSDIMDDVYSTEDSSNTEPQYYLKPVGVSEAPILLEDQRDFSDLHQNLHFSKKKPKGVRKGDVVITTAVGAGSLLSYFKVTGGLQQVTDEEISREEWKERWPWYMEGRNQSPEFGGQWWVYNIRRQDALHEFLEKYPGVAVTSAGGFSLGTLNMGSDKVRITKEFGDFLISIIENSIK